MNDFVSVIVVIVFLVIVFRKRIVPLLKRFRKSGKIETVVSNLPEDTAPPVETAFAFYEVFSIDVGNNGSVYYPLDVCDEIIKRLQSKIELISRKGKVIDVNVIPVGSMMFFFIKWI